MNRAHVMTSLRWSVVALAGLLFVQPVAGVDGVIQINQARALAGGVTPSDAPRLPRNPRYAGQLRVDWRPRPARRVDDRGRWSRADEGEPRSQRLHAPRAGRECTGSSGSNLVCTPSSGDGNGVEISGYGTAVRNGTVSGMVNGGGGLGDLCHDLLSNHHRGRHGDLEPDVRVGSGAGVPRG